MKGSKMKLINIAVAAALAVSGSLAFAQAGGSGGAGGAAETAGASSGSSAGTSGATSGTTGVSGTGNTSSTRRSFPHEFRERWRQHHEQQQLG
jgi:hypothetical protein